eukprot:7473846-Pyramimonas_sp.AAC.1
MVRPRIENEHVGRKSGHARVRQEFARGDQDGVISKEQTLSERQWRLRRERTMRRARRIPNRTQLPRQQSGGHVRCSGLSPSKARGPSHRSSGARNC